MLCLCFANKLVEKVFPTRTLDFTLENIFYKFLSISKWLFRLEH